MGAASTWGVVVYLDRAGAETARFPICGDGAPDLAVVHALAWAQLWARRQGGSVRVHNMSEELADLLDLAGLLDLVGLRGEVGGEAEGGEQVGVEEGGVHGDPVA